MAAPTAQIIVTVIILFIICIILVPLGIYHTLRVIYVRNTIIMQKRHITASIIGCFCGIGWISISTSTLHYMFLFPTSSMTHIVLDHIGQLLYPLLAQAMVYCLLFRFWMIYFTFCYSVSLSNQKWKIHINPIGCNKREQWIINHHDSWGRPRWIAVRLFIIYIVSVSATCLCFTFGLNEMYGFNVKLAQTIDIVFYLGPLITIFILWYKTPPFLDLFFCRQEMKAIVITYGIALALAVPPTILLIIVPDLEGSYWEQVAWFLPSCLGAFGTLFCQTEWVLIGIKNGGFFNDEREYSQSTKTKSAQRARAQSVNTKNRLCDVLQDTASFDAFMIHLAQEFSSECLLSYIEFRQFRQLLQSDAVFMDKVHKYEDKVEDGTQVMTSSPDTADGNRIKSKETYDFITLPGNDTIPKSAIVYQDSEDASNIQKYKKIVRELYHKYVDEYGSFCINIGYSTRCYIVKWVNKHCQYENSKMLDDKECSEMYNLFEKCRKDMYGLMKHNCDRFTKTNVSRKMTASKSQF